MQKLSTIALLGVADAVITPGPVVDPAFPAFASLVPPVDSDATVINAATKGVLPFYSNNIGSTTIFVGVIRGYRNGIVAFPTQNINAGDGTNWATVAAPTATRTFYTTTTTMLGTAAPVNTSATAAFGQTATGANWVVCLTHLVSPNCNTGLSHKDNETDALDKPQIIVGRIYAKAKITTALTMGRKTAVSFDWNMDLFMASLYHAAAQDGTAKVDGTAWCSQLENKVPKAGTALEFSATMGLTGRTKCTWQLASEDFTMGPAFKIVSSKTYFDFNAHWVEWAGAVALATGQKLPAADVAIYHLGTYAPGANGEQWLNPLKSSAGGGLGWPLGVFAWTASGTDPNAALPGSIGAVTYYPGYEGDAKEVQTTTIDSVQLAAQYASKQADNDAYNTLNGDYEKMRTSYDDASTAETARLADALKAAFEPKISIPARPCAPVRPSAYSGVFLKFEATHKAFPANYKDNGRRGNLVQDVGDSTKNNIPAANFSLKKGYTFPTKDVTTTKALGSAGHIFGRLGQSTMTLPGAMAPFAWLPVVTGNVATIQLSFFPTGDADTGNAAAADIIKCEAKVVKFAELSSFDAPGQPSEAKQPKTAAGASFLALGATSALILATLI